MWHGLAAMNTHTTPLRESITETANSIPSAPELAARQGIIHASQAMPAVLASIYHALVKEDPDLAERFRRDPLGIKIVTAS